MIGSFGNITKIPDLRNRIIFTLLMLAVYRLGVFVSTPGVDVEAIRRLLNSEAGGLFGMFNMFSGGSLENFSIFTLGIMPYISVSIIVQFVTPVFPALAALKKEGAAGQRILTRYTRYGTVALALFQSSLVAKGLQEAGYVVAPGLTFQVCTMVTLTAGTAFIMWLGEQITERGLGNGISMIILAGIVARMPSSFATLMELSRNGEVSSGSILLILAFCLITIAAIVYVERSYRKIPVQYPRRAIGKGIVPQQYLPLKVNMAGVIPPIFASAFMLLPITVLGFFKDNEKIATFLDYFSYGTTWYTIFFVVLIIVFCFYYTAVIYNPVEVADNLKKNGAFIPTVRPGQQTAEYIYGVLNRLTFWGAIYIALICVVPQVIYSKLGVPFFNQAFGGTAILIVVAVMLDMISQIESHVVARNYESFMSKTVQTKGRGTMSSMRARVLKR